MGAALGEADRRGLYRAIRTRRDVRSHFVRRPIADGALARVLDAAHHAPSVGYSQPWDFVLVRDAAVRRRVKESFEAARAAAASELEGERRRAYESLKLEGILESDLNICVTYDAARSGPFVIGRSSMPEAGAYSVCCAVQNLWLAARAERVAAGCDIGRAQYEWEVKWMQKHVARCRKYADMVSGEAVNYDTREALHEAICCDSAVRSVVARIMGEPDRCVEVPG